MTTYNYGEPTITQVILRKLARKLESKRDRQRLTTDATHGRAWFPAIVRLVLTLAGFALLTKAAYMLYPAAGFAAAGISCFLLTWLAAPSTNTNDTSTMDGRR